MKIYRVDVINSASEAHVIYVTAGSPAHARSQVSAQYPTLRVVSAKRDTEAERDR